VIKHLARWAILGLFLFTIPANTIIAAQACPEDASCVVYQNADGTKDTLQLDPTEGVYQEIVVEVRTQTIVTLSGTSNGPITVKLAGFLEKNGDSEGVYELVKEHVEPKDGIYKDAELGDSYGLTELRD
jgi:hypothetical protein